MTREEAIAMLKSKMDGSVDTSYEWAETVRMAIEALSEPIKEWDENREIIKDILQMMPTAYLLDALGVATFDELMDSEWECSKCGNWTFVKTNFCPHCGADMRGKVE